MNTSIFLLFVYTLGMHPNTLFEKTKIQITTDISSLKDSIRHLLMIQSVKEDFYIDLKATMQKQIVSDLLIKLNKEITKLV